MDKRSIRQEQMFELVEQWQRGEKSKKEFCDLNQININTFQYWIQKYRKNPNEAQFLPVKLTESSAQTVKEVIKLRFPNGVIAEISTNTDVNIIRHLILG